MATKRILQFSAAGLTSLIVGILGASGPLVGPPGVATPPAAQDPGRNLPPAEKCYTFTDAGLMCLDCTDEPCGACIDYPTNVCEHEEAKVCRHWYETTEAQSGHYRIPVTRTCYFFTACVAVFPCEGRPCENGQWVRDGGENVNVFIPGGSCSEPDRRGRG
ncbi:unnamed protein product [marine sediment metagenome]|uniref:Uncharacterized protein n=1 Tax=marine sediment metagenome TaxID=412755 RepID=X0SM59_9ZZZZ